MDYYTRPPSSSLAFAIGDVAGKGVDAMATTFVTKFMLRGAVHGGQLSWPTRPGEALQELRNGLLEQPDFAEETERFVTVLFGQLNPRTGLLQLATAGHPTPFLVRAGGVERPLLMTAPPHRYRARRRPRAIPHGDPAARRGRPCRALHRRHRRASRRGGRLLRAAHGARSSRTRTGGARPTWSRASWRRERDSRRDRLRTTWPSSASGSQAPSSSQAGDEVVAGAPREARPG